MNQQQQDELLNHVQNVSSSSSPTTTIWPVTEGLQSPSTITAYRRNFNHFLDCIGVHDLQVLLDWPPRTMQDHICDYIIHLRDSENLKRMSIEVHIAAILHFFDLNDFPISIASRKRFKRFLPPDESTHEDKPYTTEQIGQILEKCYDERTKVIILLMVSTGVRIGSIHTMQIGHLTKIPEYGLYKIQVYAHSKHDRYYCFCSPECALAIDSYLEYRKGFGEDITKKTSPLIREQFNVDDKIRIHSPRPLSNKMIVHLVEQALKRSGVKSPEIMRTHGIRKFVVSQMIKARLEYSTREYLVGHRQSRGLDVNYDRTTEEDRLAQYLLAVDLLTISNEYRLNKQVEKLEGQQAEEIANLKARVQQQDEWLNKYHKYRDGSAELLENMKSVLEENGLWPKKATKSEVKPTD